MLPHKPKFDCRITVKGMIDHHMGMVILQQNHLDKRIPRGKTGLQFNLPSKKNRGNVCSHVFIPNPWKTHCEPVPQSNTIPICSMYGIVAYIWLKFMVDVGKYTTHGMLWDIYNPSYDSALRFVHRKRPAWPCLPLVFSQDRNVATVAIRLNLPAVDERGEGYVIWVERTSNILPLDFLWLILYIAIHKSLVWILFFLV